MDCNFRQNLQSTAGHQNGGESDGLQEAKLADASPVTASDAEEARILRLQLAKAASVLLASGNYSVVVEQERSVEVLVAIHPPGEGADVRIHKTSGNRRIDEIAVRLISQAMQHLALSLPVGGRATTFLIPLEFYAE